MGKPCLHHVIQLKLNQEKRQTDRTKAFFSLVLILSYGETTGLTMETTLPKKKNPAERGGKEGVDK